LTVLVGFDEMLGCNHIATSCGADISAVGKRKKVNVDNELSILYCIFVLIKIHSCQNATIYK